MSVSPPTKGPHPNPSKHVNVLRYTARGRGWSKFADRIQVPNQLMGRWKHCSGLTTGSQCNLMSPSTGKREAEPSVLEGLVVKKILLATAGFEDGGGGHEPWNAGGL